MVVTLLLLWLGGLLVFVCVFAEKSKMFFCYFVFCFLFLFTRMFNYNSSAEGFLGECVTEGRGVFYGTAVIASIT